MFNIFYQWMLNSSFCVHLPLICVALSQLMQDHLGQTALIAAVGNGHLVVSTLLLEHGAVVNYQDRVRLVYVHGHHGRMMTLC